MNDTYETSLLHRAMNAAHTAATEDLAPEQAWVSFPLPVKGGLAFLVAPSHIDEKQERLSAYGPCASVTVSLPALECKASPLTEGLGDIVGPVWSEAAQEAEPAVREALLQEACDLAAEIAGQLGTDSPILERYDEIYRALVSRQFREHYERLAPEYFQWRGTKLSADPRSAPEQLPVPQRPLEDTSVPDPMAADLYRASEGLPRHYEVSKAAVLDALKELGLEPEENSPLFGATDRLDPEDVRLQDIASGWPDADVVPSLKALTMPEVRIEVVCGTKDIVIPVSVCAGSYDGTPAWARYEDLEDAFSIYAPDDAPWTIELIQETLASPVIKRADPTVHELSGPELSAVLALADHLSAHSDPEAPIDAQTLGQDTVSLGWSAVESLSRPEGEQAPISEGIDQLRQRGLLDGESAAFTLGPSLRAFVQTLQQPQAFAVVLTSEEDVYSQVSLVRTQQELWAWEPAEDGNVNLWQLTGKQLRSVIDEFLGTGEEE